MESALRPRDIQARIRAGESPDVVAAAAGVPVDRIAAFAAPVVAEREHVAGLAQTHPVRRRGETTSHRNLRNTIVDALTVRGVDADTMTWDAWKLADRAWRVRAVYDAGDGPVEADFTYEQQGRFSTAANDEARALIGDLSAQGRAQERPGAAAPRPVDDDLAIVRALSGSDAAPAAAGPALADAGGLHADAIDTEANDGGADDESDELDGFVEVELEEVDGVYDIVDSSDSGMDVLYDMLSSFDEDSVKIYAGLVHPKEDTAAIVTPDPGEDESEAAAPEPAPPSRDLVEEPAATAEPAAQAELAPAEAAPAAAPAEPQQLSLIDDVEVPPAPAPKPRSRKRRASVPSWDEIVFGGPRVDG